MAMYLRGSSGASSSNGSCARVSSYGRPEMPGRIDRAPAAKCYCASSFMPSRKRSMSSWLSV